MELSQIVVEAAQSLVAGGAISAYRCAMTDSHDTAAPTDAVCPACQKPQALCVCEGIAPIANKIGVLILQHPQEQDIELGTARLAALHLKNAVMKVGLSWPNLAKALGRNADPKKWAVLYLGSAVAAKEAPGQEVVLVDKKGKGLEHQAALLSEIEGIIVLDGTWSQAKAMWWRNAWLLKCRRVILGPKRASRYGKLRKEPRKDGLSTIESVAMLLGYLERKTAIEASLNAGFERMLAKVQALRQA
jgi:DTW domain-containing protein YfiP